MWTKSFIFSTKIKQLTRQILSGNFFSQLPLQSYLVNVSPWWPLTVVNILSLARCLIPPSPLTARCSRCEEGMIFSGPSYRTICQADGRWSHPVPRCYGEFQTVGAGKTNKGLKYYYIGNISTIWLWPAWSDIIVCLSSLCCSLHF